MKRYDSIVWDWNGTLLDDVDLSLEVVNELLGEARLDRVALFRDCSVLDTRNCRAPESCTNPRRTVVIGDTNHEAQVAGHLRADCILISNGHQSAGRLSRLQWPVFDSLRSVVAGG